jgi:flagellar motor switch protein FliM
MSDAQSLVKLGLASDRARRACERMTTLQRALEGAIRRSLPYIVRRKIAVTAEVPRPALEADVIAALTRPFHVTPLRVGGSARTSGALVLDGNAIAHGLDGLLGGGRGEVTALDTSGLSAAQSALATRLARGLVAAFAEVLAAAGTTIEIATDAGARGQQGAVLVACSLRIGAGEGAGTIVLLVPAAAVEVGESVDVTRDDADPAMHAAVVEAELEVVAELGRVRLPLSRLVALCVGDVIRLPLSVDALARLHVGGRALFEGKPTTRGSQIAIEVVGHGA